MISPFVGFGYAFKTVPKLFSTILNVLGSLASKI
jgi:hypothetical protein